MDPRLLPALLCCGMLLLLAPSATAQSDTTGTFTECTLRLNDRRSIPVEHIWSIADGRMVYLRDGSLHDLLTKEIREVRCNGRTYTITNDTLRALPTERSMATLPVVVDSTTDLRALGRSDARNYYGGGGNFAVGLLTAPTIIIPLMVAAVPPATSNPRRNPRAALYATHADYRKGYRGQAHGKKAGLTLGGMVLGLVLLATISGY